MDDFSAIVTMNKNNGAALRGLGAILVAGANGDRMGIGLENLGF
jgi:hypothetical protein